MDKIILSSTSTPLSTSSLPPLRTVTSTASLSSPKKLFLLRSTQSQRKLSSSSRRSTSFCKVHKSTTITCGAITEINESEFQNVVLNSDRPVLVEFVATWCGPCRLISPAMESVAQVSFFLTILFNHDYTLAFDYKRVFFFTVPIHVFLRCEQNELILMIFLVRCG
jgi:thiol-disulfide isomerase/thioredoxin